MYQPNSLSRRPGRTSILLLATLLLASIAAPSHASPPVAQSASATAFTNFPLNQPLLAADDGLPNPWVSLTFTITTLPAHGTLSDPAVGPIASVPYTLATPGRWVRYTSAADYTGPDSFTFTCNDGGATPENGESDPATIRITVRAPKAVHAAGSNDAGAIGQAERPSFLPEPVLLANVVTVVASLSHNLAIKSDGTVWAWGGNDYGQLGDGTTLQRNIPVQVIGLSDIVAVASASGHCLALKADGTVWGWGLNTYGQTGNGGTTDVTIATCVPNLYGVVSVAAGGSHSLALKSDGTVWGWGANWSGQLGDGTGVPHGTPVQIIGPSSVVALAAGGGYNLALDSSGAVWSWGDNYAGQLGDGTHTTRPAPGLVTGLSDVVAVAASIYHCLALRSDGTVWSWGDNGIGHQGDGSSTPVQIPSLADVVSVSAGSSFSLALKSDGSVWASGSNSFGQRGDGDPAWRAVPIRVAGLPPVRMIEAGNVHSVVLAADGSIWAWGYNGSGQLGDGASVVSKPNQESPAEVSGLSGVVAVSAGSDRSMALKSDGTLWAWGNNHYGQLGNGTADSYSHPVPAQVSGLSGVVMATSGTDHSLAIKSDGTVWTWGYNPYGQLGDGTAGSGNNRSTPVQVLYVSAAVSVAGGACHSLAVGAGGTLWVWGGNQSGQLGDGGTVDRLVPLQITSLAGVVAVAAGDRHSLALKSDGTVWAWGNNYYAQIGDGGTTARYVPVKVQGLASMAAVAGGYAHSLALKSDGTVWAWGWNAAGQLGDGTTTRRNTPIQVPGLSDVVAVKAGSFHSMAIKSDGTTWIWGRNDDGQLGDGTTTMRKTPVQVPGLFGVAAAGGSYHTLFLGDFVGNGPHAIGTWPAASNTERAVSQVVVSFDLPVQNVSPEDLVLSAGAVTGVQGTGKGPYLFTVTGVLGGSIAATIGGDITSLDGVALQPHPWVFQMLYPGDVNGDSHVDVMDLLALVDAFGTRFAGAGYDSSCDFNCDGDVDVVDLLALVYVFGT